jgi:hypothetical protein
MAAYNALSRDEIEAARQVQPHNFAGVEQSEDVLEWIWSNFSAVAGDQPAFECWRECFFFFQGCRRTMGLISRTATQREFLLHEVLLAGWGCPIGELFDLEALAEHCKLENRWSFFVTSKVCNVSFICLQLPSVFCFFLVFFLIGLRSLEGWQAHRIF